MEKTFLLELTDEELSTVKLMLIEKYFPAKESFEEHNKFYRKTLDEYFEKGDQGISFQEYGEMLAYEQRSLKRLESILDKIKGLREKEEEI